MNKQLSAVKNFKLLLAAGEQFMDFMEVVAGMFETGNKKDASDEEIFSEIVELEKFLPAPHSSDEFLTNVDFGGQVFVLYCISLKNEITNLSTTIRPNVNTIMSYRRKLAFTTAITEEYLLRNIPLVNENKPYELIVCNDWKAYKRYHQSLSI